MNAKVVNELQSGAWEVALCVSIFQCLEQKIILSVILSKDYKKKIRILPLDEALLWFIYCNKSMHRMFLQK